MRCYWHDVFKQQLGQLYNVAPADERAAILSVVRRTNPDPCPGPDVQEDSFKSTILDSPACGDSFVVETYYGQGGRFYEHDTFLFTRICQLWEAEGRGSGMSIREFWTKVLNVQIVLPPIRVAPEDEEDASESSSGEDESRRKRKRREAKGPRKHGERARKH